jgi:16S rRNA (cytidine1402-2'-O)-methyltransferase
MAMTLGPRRAAAVCRELTKRFEEVTRAPLAELAEIYAAREVKGEIVIVVDRGEGEAVEAEVVEQALLTALKVMSVKDAATEVARSLGLPRRDLYRRALELGEKT